ncbi:MAG TPA: hypothetical protein VGE79_07560, partial [Niastella sp.]
MERLAQLIGKLNEQFAQNADPFQLLVTTQLIETELVQMSTSTHRTVHSSKVAVVMPAATAANGHSYHSTRNIKEETVTQTTQKPVAKHVVVEAPPVVVEEPPVVVEPAPVVIETATAPVAGVNGVNGTVDKNGNGHHHPEIEQADNGWKIDPLREVPTLAH